MEAAGLVVGVVGLARLIGAFKDAIDLFHNFTESRAFGRDYEILDTKIYIEKTLLLQWADQVNLLWSDYDPRLDEQSTQHAVAQILACIRLFMSNGTKLRRHYGLIRPEPQQSALETDRIPAISAPRMELFQREFEKLKIQMDVRSQKTPLQKGVRWVIQDKQKFQDLVRVSPTT